MASPPQSDSVGSPKELGFYEHHLDPLIDDDWGQEEDTTKENDSEDEGSNLVSNPPLDMRADMKVLHGANTTSHPERS